MSVPAPKAAGTPTPHMKEEDGWRYNEDADIKLLCLQVFPADTKPHQRDSIPRPRGYPSHACPIQLSPSVPRASVFFFVWSTRNDWSQWDRRRSVNAMEAISY